MNYVSTNLYGMPPRKPIDQYPPQGQVLIRRREEVGVTSLGQVEILTDGVVYKQLAWRLDNGHTHPRNLNAEQESAYARILEWTRDEFREALGLPPIPRMPNDEVIQRDAWPVGDFEIPYVFAGAGLPQWNDDQSETIGLMVPQTRRGSPGEHFAVRIVGDSMRDYAADGDLVVFRRADEADKGKIVAVHIPDDGLIVKCEVRCRCSQVFGSVPDSAS